MLNLVSLCENMQKCRVCTEPIELLVAVERNPQNDFGVSYRVRSILMLMAAQEAADLERDIGKRITK